MGWVEVVSEGLVAGDWVASERGCVWMGEVGEGFGEGAGAGAVELDRDGGAGESLASAIGVEPGHDA